MNELKDINISQDGEEPSFHLSGIESFPEIGLYLDQVLLLVENELSPLVAPGENVLTGAMVNNYVKHRLLPTPVKKKYNRRQVAMLVVICFFKQVYSMAEVASLLRIATAADVDDIDGYDTFVDLVNRQYERCWRSLRGEEMPPTCVEGNSSMSDTPVYRLFHQAVASVCERAVVEYELRKIGD